MWQFVVSAGVVVAVVFSDVVGIVVVAVKKFF